jgi:hypothetical protein
MSLAKPNCSGPDLEEEPRLRNPRSRLARLTALGRGPTRSDVSQGEWRNGARRCGTDGDANSPVLSFVWLPSLSAGLSRSAKPVYGGRGIQSGWRTCLNASLLSLLLSSLGSIWRLLEASISSVPSLQYSTRTVEASPYAAPVWPRLAVAAADEFHDCAPRRPTDVQPVWRPREEETCRNRCASEAAGVGGWTCLYRMPSGVRPTDETPLCPLRWHAGLGHCSGSSPRPGCAMGARLRPA